LTSSIAEIFSRRWIFNGTSTILEYHDLSLVDLFLSFLFDLWIDARAETNPDGSITVHARPMITKDPAFENL
jgi:hypothetical protein